MLKMIPVLGAVILGIGIAFAPDDAVAKGPGGHGGPGGARAFAAAPFQGGMPRGFTRGRKTGWNGMGTPPGWRHGRKSGWQGRSVPPGWR